MKSDIRANESVLDQIERKSLKWFGHLLRMPDNRCLKKVFQWTPPGRRKRGRPRRSWNGTIRETMSNRNLEEDDIFNREVWRWETERRQN